MMPDKKNPKYLWMTLILNEVGVLLFAMMGINFVLDGKSTKRFNQVVIIFYLLGLLKKLPDIHIF
jgi:hypothetical protein